MRINAFKCFPVFLTSVATFAFALLLMFSVGGLHNPAKAFADQGKNESGKIEGKKPDNSAKQSDEYNRKMEQLDTEKSRKLSKIEEEYDRELGKAEDEYQNDIAKDDETKAQAKFQKKRDDLDSKFIEKQNEIAKWYEEKAGEISGNKTGKN